jgi:hypothetical protein
MAQTKPETPRNRDRKGPESRGPLATATGPTASAITDVKVARAISPKPQKRQTTHPTTVSNSG